ncbi:unnamed protein product [Triticum turgidum subsp. durum]|uniref:Uncharacterized protein n=1 Tax=Triticum turgidum subsp. durum TaxID=4567 RepID=A0A9R1PBD1_TRITD|nr:unnamed protein product [Triticum turgidum subsp. durum]
MSMDLATGAMSSLLPKLLELLKEEYKLDESAKEGIMSLDKEMKSMQAPLRKVAEVPHDQLDKQVKIWAGEVRELSFDMEDVVDKFLVHFDDDSESAANSNKLTQLTEKFAGLFTKGKGRHGISVAIKVINKQVQEVAERRARYNVDNVVIRPAVVSPDPRLWAVYTEVTELVGIARKREELMKLLSVRDMSKKKMKILSIVGFVGLGKTTLVKNVYDEIKGDFDCSAFVCSGPKADPKKVLMDILVHLGVYENQLTLLDEKCLINKLRESLENKRYLIVIDDIWDETLWRVVNYAFSNSNNLGSRIITTTRIISVSKLCSSSANDSVYQMQPLNDDDSESLFYKRIFPHESGCPYGLEEVSIAILNKCGGVPLAILTAASLLASNQQIKTKDQCHVLLQSIGHGLTEDPHVNEMLRIVSFSYFDLPSYLKTCLLYLSMFLDDQEIGKDRLIWMWIAESFVQYQTAKSSLFEIGETYFNELVNRSLIQPVYDYRGIVCACRVHAIVLDLICGLSSEENFATMLNGTGDMMYCPTTIRRLSLQNARKEEHQTTRIRSMSMSQLRSVVTSEPAIGVMPPFSSFAVLRVLDLTGCDVSRHNHLNLRELGRLLHLRYLGLSTTGISDVPEEVGKLQFLQVLDLRQNLGIKELPSSVTQLRRLMCLLVDCCCKLPDGFGNLTSMEVLQEICGDSRNVVEELGNMERLRKLNIWFNGLSLKLEVALVESLVKLSKIQSVEVGIRSDDLESMYLLGERWVPPRSLREFSIIGSAKFSRLPAWIRRNPLRLSVLSQLNIFVEELRQEDMGFLARLPALCILELWTLHQRLLVVAADGFCCLTYLTLFSDSPGQVVFQPGALPRAEQVALRIGLRVAKEEAARNSGDWFDLRMGSLPLLQNVDVEFDYLGMTVREAKQAEAALENALHAHPNCPTFRIHPEIPEGAHDDDVYIEDDGSE